MIKDVLLGRVHSIQSLGTVDGPGIRYVVFLYGCNLKCGCCHNPDTRMGGEYIEYTAPEIIKKAKRFREYFAKDGGITISGGEPLLQTSFATQVFSLAKKEGINTCLDTSGSILNDDVKELLRYTDTVLLDIKYTNDSLYREHAGCSLQAPIEFLSYLNERKINTIVRQVIIPTLNNNEENIIKLAQIAREHECVVGVELLPFRKICEMKYEKLGIRFPHGHLPEPTAEEMAHLNKILAHELSKA